VSPSGVLHDMVAVITGAASGIGRAEAELFSSEGAIIVAIDRSDAVREAPSGSGLRIVCDVSDASQVKAALEEVKNVLGRCDILVNTAGIALFGRAGECSEADWDRVFAVNVRGTWLMCRAVLPMMMAAHRGSIVNISSASGLRPMPDIAAYSASKAAVIGLTRSIALDYAPFGIRANVICPGVIDTPQSAAWLESRRAQGLPAVTDQYAIASVGAAEDVARAALYLASDASRYTTGIAIAVDGGRTFH
jgi:NAD(P)-dependent dehydrogenase (short-subunit alcohol dehydrogenase family)